MDQDGSRLRAIAEQVAGQAGELVNRMRADAVGEVRTKSSRTDVVTSADTEAERLIRARLAELTPGAEVLGEEGGLAGSAEGGDDRVRWVVDPIDGTVNYLYGIPWYAVSVAATIGGRAVAGAVVEPASGRVWSANAGGGATLDGHPLRVSAAQRLELALVGTGFSYLAERRAGQGELASALLRRVRDIRRFGSAALDLCAVAAGWLDGYYEHSINPWDWAAGALIAQEAGAVVRPPDPAGGLGSALVAATPAILDELIAALSELGAADL